jgi:outer membrane protein assembly factor BamB
MKLAKSIWPRSGGGPGNTSKVECLGPVSGHLAWTVALPASKERITDKSIGGVVTCSDGSLRVTHNGSLFAVTVGQGIDWQVPLLGGDNSYHSLPVALDDDATLVTLTRAIIVVDVQGTVRTRIETEDLSLDDQGPSPCVTESGTLVISSPTGEVMWLDGAVWRPIDVFGYDILPPAVFADGTLAISGYSGSGYCRIELSGRSVWKAELADPDLLPTVASNQCSAVGCLNYKVSIFVSPRGEVLGRYARAAVFAEHNSGGWVALSDGCIALLGSTGNVIWQKDIPIKRTWGACQPVVDSQGNIYAPIEGGVVGFDPDGDERFRYRLSGAQPDSLSMIAPGKLAFVIDNHLAVIS